MPNFIPTVIDKSGNTSVGYDIYSRLLKDRIIFITGEIDDQLSSIIISELLYLDSLNHNDIYIYINSIGGEVTSGLAIYDTIKYIKSDVNTICIGLAASMGAFLLSSGTKGKRFALPNSEIMIHQPLGGAKGKATDIEIAANHILKLKNKLNKILAKNTNKNIKTIIKDTKDDYFMSALEAQEYNLIDEIITNKKN